MESLELLRPLGMEVLGPLGYMILEVGGLLERTGYRIADMGLVHTVEEVGQLAIV